MLKRIFGYTKDKKAWYALSILGLLAYAVSGYLQVDLIKCISVAFDQTASVSKNSLDTIVPASKMLPEGQSNISASFCSEPATKQQYMFILPIYIIITFLVRGIGLFLSTYYMEAVSRTLMHRVRVDLFASILSMSLNDYNQQKSGGLISRITFQVEQMSTTITTALMTTFRETLLIVGTLAAMFLINWQLTLLFIITLPLIAGLIAFATKFIRRYSKRIQESVGDVTEVTNENIKGLPTVKLYSQQDHQLKRFSQTSNYNANQYLKLGRVKAISTPLLQIIIAVGLAFVTWVALSWEVSTAEFLPLLTGLVAMAKPFKNVSNVNVLLQRGLVAAKDVFEQIDNKPECDDKSGELDAVGKNINFMNIAFDYEEKNALFEGFNLTVPQGKTIALVGRSGSGKSTIANLLPRFYLISSGEIKIGDQSIYDVSLKSLRDNIAFVTQQPMIFSGSIKENILIGRPKASDEEILSAARKAHVLEFTDSLSDGLDTVVGMDGAGLSGGQKQRVVIARAILKDAPILILDEATSALDNESERLIQQALNEVMKNRTTIVIAHRLSTIEKADNIVVLDKGKIVEQGSHLDLLKAKGVYFGLSHSES